MRNRRSGGPSPGAAGMPEGFRPSGIPLARRSLSRLAFGALAIIGGILCFSPLPAWVEGRHLTVEATYISQVKLYSFDGPSLQVKVRYALRNGSDIVADVYPLNDSIPSTAKSIPVVYYVTDPGRAYYAGPGGDYNDPDTQGPFYQIIGFALVPLGLYLVVSVTAWRWRIALLARSGPGGQRVDVRWQHERRRNPVVFVTDRKTGSEYAWEVLPVGTPADEAVRDIRRLVRGIRRLLRPVGKAAANLPALLGPTAAPELLGEAELFGAPGPHRWLVLRAGNDTIFPASLAEPIVGTGPYPARPRNYADVLAAHRRLLAAYASALIRAGHLPLFVRAPNPNRVLPAWHSLRTLLCLRPVVRLHVEAHLRRQLRHLARAYLQAQLLVPGEGKDAEQERRGLADLRGECELFSGSLPNAWRQAPSGLVALATVISGLAVIVQVHQVQAGRALDAALRIAVLILLYVPGLFALTGYTDAFRSKRALFESSPTTRNGPHSTRESIYELENELFARLGQQKLLERASDFRGYALILVTWVTFATWLIFTSPGFLVVYALATLVSAFILVKMRIRRQGEPR